MHALQKLALLLMTCAAAFSALVATNDVFALPRPATQKDLPEMYAAGVPNPHVGMLWDPKDPFVGVGVADAKVYLLTKNNQTGDHIYGLQAEFACRLSRFLKASDLAGHDIRITSGYRSEQRQHQISRGGANGMACGPRNGSYAHCPHVNGRAADLVFNRAPLPQNVQACAANSACLWAHTNALRFGLHFPLMPGKSSLVEPWHIELNRSVSSASTGEKCGDVNAGAEVANLTQFPFNTGNSLRTLLQPAPPPAPIQAAQPLPAAQQQPLQSAFQPVGAAPTIASPVGTTPSVTNTAVPVGTASTQTQTQTTQKKATSTLDLLSELAFGTSTNVVPAVTFVPVNIDGSAIGTLQPDLSNVKTLQGTSPGGTSNTYTSPDLSGVTFVSQTGTFTSSQATLENIKARLITILGYLQPFGGKAIRTEHVE